MRTLKIKFITEDGSNFNVSMNYAAENLAEAEGAAKVKAAADLILEKQPFAVVLLSCDSAELVESTSTEIALTSGD